ncbi:MAG TPA: TatD family hydrolase [Candidatus Aminicenantes bacterium]|nr:TatD family hydrolase [Candidatus Aminicenantes bacterium]
MNPLSGWLDFHCHLDDPDFDADRDRVATDGFATGAWRIVSAADPYEGRSLELTRALADRHPGVRVTAGAHPHRASDYSAEVERRLLEFLPGPATVGLGEVGLDRHYQYSPLEDQERVFRRQIALARELALPLIIHSREAEERVLELLDLERFDRPFAFHCYTGSEPTAAAIVARGGLVSISGIVTFRKAEAVQHIAATLPAASLLTETDSPYLAPEPHRGGRNTPQAVPAILRRIAELRGQGPESLAEVVRENARRFHPNFA